MVQDPIDKWNKLLPAGGTKIYDGDDEIRDNNAAIEEMAGGWMQDLIVTNGSAGQIDIDATRLGLVKNTGTPPLVYVDRAINLTCDWANGEAINGREASLPTTAGWKYLWVLRDPVAGTTGSLFSAATAIGSVTMPGDYAFGRLVGAAYWDGATDFTAFLQNGNDVVIKTHPLTLSNGRSDAVYGEIDISARIPAITLDVRGYGTMRYLGNIAYDTASLEIAANSSGNYRSLYAKWQLGALVGAATIVPFIFKQRLLAGSQSIYYYTIESYSSCEVDIWIAGYTVKI